MASFFGEIIVLFSITGASISANASGKVEYFTPVQVGLITDTRIKELSGMVRVTEHPNYYWIHNDSDDLPRIFAVAEGGTVIAEVAVAGAAAIDWEDIASGPGPEAGRTYLYVADTGNNNLSRQEFIIYRFPEPRLPHLQGGQQIVSEPSEKIPFRYPSGTFNCEALVINPLSGDIYLITKNDVSAGVYRFASPAPGGLTQTLVPVRDLHPGDLVTAADVSGDGRRLLLRTYSQVLEYELPGGEAFEDIFLQTPRILPDAPAEAKSESICYDHEGIDYLTSNEGNPAPIHKAIAKISQPFCEVPPEDIDSLRFIRGNVVVEEISGAACVNITDTAAMLEGLRGGLLPECADPSDFNDDGVLDIADVTQMLYQLTWGRAPVAPFPVEGLDPTTDDLSCFEENRLVLLDETASWSFWYSDSPPAPGWNQPGADLTGWNEGRGGIGTGSESVETPLPVEPDRSITLYARSEFELADVQGMTSLVLELDRNDGFIAFLNGVEVARQGLGTVGFEAPPDLPALYHPGGRFEDYSLCPELLLPGTNVLALEVHNRSLGDKTLFFRGGLRASTRNGDFQPGSGEPPRAGGSIRLSLDRSPRVGDTGVIHVLADVDVPLRGASICLNFQTSRISITGVQAGEKFREHVLDDFYPNLRTGRLIYAMVVDPDFFPEGIEPDGEELELATLDYEVTASTAAQTTLAFYSRATQLPQENWLVTGDLRSFRPELEDLLVEIGEADHPPEWVRADASADGAFDISDAIAILNYTFTGSYEILCEKTADFDDNGKLGVTDAILFLSYLVLGNAEPLNPFPGCGFDPTPDELSCDSYPPCE